MTISRNRPRPAIRWQGRRLNLTEACAVALAEHQRGNFTAVADIYALILKQAPASAEVLNNQGVVLQQLQRLDEALASYDRAIAFKPGYANAHYNRGTLLKKMRRHEDALASYTQAVAWQPSHVEALNNRGVLLQEMRRLDEALACYDQVIARQPDHAQAYNNRGILLVSKGDMAGAEKMFRQAATLKPDFPDPWFNLANIRHYQDPDHADVQHIRNLLDRPSLAPEDREHLCFTLGIIHDDCDLPDQAFEYFHQANQLRNAQVAYDPGLVERATDAAIEVFHPDFLQAPVPFASDNPAPLFIVGMPRSGTTLLASILSNHPAVANAGELAILAELAAQLPAWSKGCEPYPAVVKHLSAAAGRQLITGYEQRLRRDVAAVVPYVIDKNPLNFRYLGLIHRLFPRARIFHCTRHPLATCLSNYFQRFPLHMDYSFDLRNIGHFYREYDRLMQHWRRLPALQMLEVSYEDMILDTERTARRALDFIRLEWNPRCLAPHTNPGMVETASQWQVRQPIYRQSLEKWRHYEKYLAPLTAMLPARHPITAGLEPVPFAAVNRP